MTEEQRPGLGGKFLTALIMASGRYCRRKIMRHMGHDKGKIWDMIKEKEQKQP